MADSTVVRHRLTNRDETTLTAECSVCGFVSIRRAGNGFQCSVKKAESHRTWAKANPQKASDNRRLKSDHSLLNRDYKSLTARCSKCDQTVDLIMYGAGYACGVRARELRSVQQATNVGGRCRECVIIDGPANAPRLRADGSCPRCAEGPDRYVASHVPAERRQRDNGLAAEYEGAGFTIVYDDDDPHAMPERESAVPGWKTIGSTTRRWDEV